jgi:hypothetical protein
MRTDGQTDVAKLIVAFRNIANAPKNCFFVNPVTVAYLGHCRRDADGKQLPLD